MAGRALKTLAAIDAGIAAGQKCSFRWHLGASQIGRPCAREIWYKHRWVKDVRPQPRIERLFNRGHREEDRFVEWLEGAGIDVRAFAPDGKQWQVRDESGHFGGSLDGILYDVPDAASPEEALLGEFKTHNAKSFANLVARGVALAKPEHVVQMCVYMGAKKIERGLYLAICKDDDELHSEVVDYDPEINRQAHERAHYILNTDEPPPRIGDLPTFWMCRNCDVRGVCHGTTVPDINCRTCAHVAIGVDGTWNCTKHGYVFTKELEDEGSQSIPRMIDGCHDHVFNPYMLNGVEFLGGNEAENYTTLRFKNGIIVENGPTRTPSDQICLSDPSPISKKPLTKPSRSSRAKTKATV